MAERKADARWACDLKSGEGTMRLGSGAFEGRYSTRFSAPGLDDDEFQRTADAAEQGCPVSKALAATEITLNAELASG